MEKKRARLEKRRFSANHLFYLDKLSASFRPGEFPSIFKGEGSELLGYRPYEPTDHPRRIDFAKSSAQFYSTGQLLVREYMERKKMSVIFSVDVTFSEIVGKHESKLSQSIFFVELLTDYCIREGVEVGYLILFGEKTKFIPPPSSKKGIERALELIRKPRAGEKTDFLRPLRKLIGFRRASVVFFVSDFITELNWGKAMSRCKKVHVVVPIVLVDRLDSPFSRSPGVLQVKGIESGNKRITDMKGEEHYLPLLKDYFKESGVDAYFIGKGGDEEVWFNRLLGIFNEIRKEGRR